jgi:hypothetical protein
MPAFSFPFFTIYITLHSPNREAPLQKTTGNTHYQQIGILLIINELSTNTHENTGNKPAIPESNNKYNKTRNSPITESNTATTVTPYLNQQKHPTGK